MRSTLILLPLLLAASLLSGQTFELLYNIGDEDFANEIKSVEYYDGSIYAIQWYPDLAITKIDENTGEVQDELLSDIVMYVGWRAGSSMDENGNIYIAGSDYINENPKVVKVSPELEVQYEIDYQLLNDSINHLAHACDVFDDKLYILLDTYLLESTDTSPESGEGSYPGVLVTDLDGQIIDGPFWIDTENSKDVMWNIHVTQDGIYLGGRYEPLILDGDDVDPLIMKMSHDGDLEWQVEIEDDQLDMSFDNFRAALKVHEDGSVYAGSFINPQWISGAGRASLSKISSSGEVLWTKTYDPPCITCRFNEIILEEDAIYGVGSTATDNQQLGMLMKLSYEGDSLWTRSYAYNLADENSSPTYQFYDFKRLDDGGFVCVGHDLFDGPQKSWVVRTDEFGCLIPGCSVGVDDYTPAEQVLLYPNPASNRFNIEANFPVLSVQLFDLQGRIVRSYHQSEPSYPLTDLPAGCYSVVVQGEREMVFKRLVVSE